MTPRPRARIPVMKAAEALGSKLPSSHGPPMAEQQTNEYGSIVGGIVALLSAIGGLKYFSRAKTSSTDDRVRDLERKVKAQDLLIRERDADMELIASKVGDMETNLHSIGRRVRNVEVGQQDIERIVEDALAKMEEILLSMRRVVSKKVVVVSPIQEVES